jgi:hypothetical protein
VEHSTSSAELTPDFPVSGRLLTSLSGEQALVLALGQARQVARTSNPDTNLGAPHVGFTCGAFDFAFFWLVLHPSQPFVPPRSRSTLIFDYSLQNT